MHKPPYRHAATNRLDWWETFDIYEPRITTLIMSIRSFADKDTETVWRDRRVRRFQGIQAQAKRKLNVLNAAGTLDDLRNNPGARLHRLKGDRTGQWTIAVNNQYRIVFDWNDGPINVEITDYHR